MPYAASRLTLALAGDLVPMRGLSGFCEPSYASLLSLLRQADLRFANLETCVRLPGEGEAGPSEGMMLATDPALLEDIRWMGFQLLSCANNHVTDYGIGAVRAAMGHLRRAGLIYAGFGENLAEARAPAYFDAPGGRVALVAATSAFRPWNRAAAQRPDGPGRPGVNPLALQTRYTLDGAAYGALEAIAERLGMQQAVRRRRALTGLTPTLPVDELSFLGNAFRRGEQCGVETIISTSDAEANLRMIAEAKRRADWVIFSFHAHDIGGDAERALATMDIALDRPAPYVEHFARAAIDAGADVVVGHGPHLTLGVEVYRGKPILYSLGNFLLQYDSVPTFPSEVYERFGLGPEAGPADVLDARSRGDTADMPAFAEYWHGLMAQCVFDDSRLTALRLYPVDLGHGASRGRRGRPTLATGATAKTILDRLERQSRPFGTTISRENECGIISIDHPC